MDEINEIEESGTLIPLVPGFWLAPLKSSKQGDMRFTVVPRDGVFIVREGLRYKVIKGVIKNISNNK